MLCIVAVAVLATGTTAHAASTNPWAVPAQPYGNGMQGNMQGGFNFGGGFGFGAGNNNAPQSALRPVAPAPRVIVPAAPAQIVPKPVAPGQNYQAPNLQVPNSNATPYGQYPPLSNNNATSSLGSTLTKPQTPAPAQPAYRQPYGYGYGVQPPAGYGIPYGGGFNPFGFGGFNGGFNFGFNGFGNGLGNGFGGGGPGIFTAPGPLGPGYAMPNYGYGNGYRGVPLYQAPAPKVK